ncbi:hypothetical protein ACFYO0_30350 [Streptomyces sp. NPDC006365]|uniref:hypothetical protein n=1 Tax=Streptomyces sp. NPDC006365 TaxID=3364744 RepID=UPI0036CE6765
MTERKCSRRGGPLRTTACSSTSSHAWGAPWKEAPGRRSGSVNNTRPVSHTGRGSTWATAAAADLASMRNVPSAVVIRVSARCSSQATTSAAAAWTVVIAAPA